jgi:hypothetical protein
MANICSPCRTVDTFLQALASFKVVVSYVSSPSYYEVVSAFAC